MQNKGYEAAGLNMVYFYTETDNEHLGDIVNGLRYMNFAGFAVTKPNKVKVLEYLDELDPLCQKMGSSNTVVKTPEGKLIGYNTDGVGFYTALTEEAGVKADQCVFFCFGGGGAGRAMCSILLTTGLARFTSQTSLKAVPSPSSMTSTRILLLSQSSSLMETFRNYRPAMWSLTPAALAWGVPSGKRRSPRNT